MTTRTATTERHDMTDTSTDIEQITDAIGEIFTAMQRVFEPLATAIATAFTPELCDAIAETARAEAAHHRSEAKRLRTRAHRGAGGSLHESLLRTLDFGRADEHDNRAGELESAARKLTAVWK